MNKMRIRENKTILIAIIWLKDRFRSWENYLFNFGFPILFSLIFFFVYNSIEIPMTDLNQFDYGFPGMIIYTAGIGTISAAVAFTSCKTSGILERMDTMPIGRKKLFLGVLLSESLS